MQRYYYIFNTTAGYSGILASTAGLLRTTLPQPSDVTIRQMFGNSIDYTTWSPDFFQDITARLQAYFKGHKVTFADRLDMSGATPWQRQVWQSTRLIPYGETRSYKWLAEQTGKPAAARAVGQALGRNPLPVIIPCHRVLAGNGHLGGFSGGTATKEWLLSLEVSANG